MRTAESKLFLIDSDFWFSTIGFRSQNRKRKTDQKNINEYFFILCLIKSLYT